MSSRESKKTITVAIPTLGRFEEVRDTIEALLIGTRLPEVILVSDQNSPSIPELDAYLKSRSPVIRAIRTEPRGVVFNMNTLLGEADSDVILYIDDDVIPSPRLVEAHLKNYTDGNVAGVAGRVEQPAGDLPPGEIREVGQFNQWTGGMVFRFNGMIRQECVFSQGANMSFDRRLLARIGGFDEGFTGNGYFFESDATLRLVEAFPHRLIFDPEATLKHLAAPRGGARIHNRSIHHANYVHNAIRLYRKHCPSMVYPLLIGKLAAVTMMKAIFRMSPSIAILGFRALFTGLRDARRKDPRCARIAP